MAGLAKKGRKERVRTTVVLWVGVTFVYFVVAWTCNMLAAPVYWLIIVVNLLCTSLYALAAVLLGRRLVLEITETCRELTESEERFRRLAENAVDIVYRYEFRPNRRVAYVSQAVKRILGYSPEEFYADPELPVAIINSDDLAVTRARVATSDPEMPWASPPTLVRWRHRDGQTVWTEQSVTRILDTAGQLVAIEGIIRDVSERHRTELELRENKSQLEETLAELRNTQQRIIQQERLHALGQMASGIAHDFNNALAQIIGYVDLLLARSDDLRNPDKVRDYLDRISTAASDAANIVRGLREFYRFRDPADLFDAVDANRLVEDVITLTLPRWRNQAQANGVTIQVEADLEDVSAIHGNASDLREMLTNLLLNSVDALPRGGRIILRTRNEESYVVLEVADDGIGMTEDVRRRSFEPFFTTKGPRGSGIGLSMVYGIVQRHHGTIDVESAVGKGTTVVVRLPAASPDSAGRRADERHQARLTPRRILLVDDDPLVLNVLVELLCLDGHDVATGVNGREGLATFIDGRFDVIVTDRAMPIMGGDQLALAIKQRAPEIPVILLTGFGDAMLAAGEVPPGADLVVGKPVTLASIRAALAKVCGDTEALASTKA